MNNLEHNLQFRSNIEDAQKKLKQATDAYNQEQINFKMRFIEILDKVALYSAGIISLSITFLGYLLSTGKEFFNLTFIGLPIYAFLYSSWISLALSLIFVFAYRLKDAHYLFYVKQHDWQKSRKKYEQAQIQFLESDYPILYSPDTSKDDSIQISKENIQKLDNALTTTSKRERISYALVTILKFLIGLTFLIGISLLLVFVIFVTHSLFS